MFVSKSPQKLSERVSLKPSLLCCLPFSVYQSNLLKQWFDPDAYSFFFFLIGRNVMELCSKAVLHVGHNLPAKTKKYTVSRAVRRRELTPKTTGFQMQVFLPCTTRQCMTHAWTSLSCRISLPLPHRHFAQDHAPAMETLTFTGGQ